MGQYMEKCLDDNDFIISKTDLKGKITYGNEKFIAMSGYQEKELLGAPHNILRDPQMPKLIFALLWERIKKKQEIFAFVKNRCKNGDFYWVFANVTASLNENGEIIGYYSVRRKPNKEAIQKLIPLYKKLIDIEHSQGIEGSREYLNETLKKEGISYDEFIISLQK